MSTMVLENLVLSAFAIILNKARDEASEKLGDGGVTSKTLSDIIKRDLHDIKEKIDCLSRKDLLASLNFLEQGVIRLSKCFDEVKKFEVEETNDAYNSNMSSATCGVIRYDLLNEIKRFTQRVEKIKSDSNFFEEAKDLFTKARDKATEAFSNEGLQLNDRIFAVKIQVVAQILLYIKSPEKVIDFLFGYIRSLHELDKVSEMFSVHIEGGGWLSTFTKSERVENIKSVMILNLKLNQFITSIRKSYHDALTWPSIKLQQGKMFNPILNWYQIFTPNSWDEKLITSPIELVYAFPFLTFKHYNINSRNEIIVCSTDKIEVMKRDAKVVVVFGFDFHFLIVACSLDEDDNLYILGERFGIPVLYIFDRHFHEKEFSNSLLNRNSLEATLSWDRGLFGWDSVLKVQNMYLVVLLKSRKNVYVCDNTGILQKKIVPPSKVHAMSLSNKNEIILAGDKIIYVYSMEGIKISTIIPEIDILDLVFHFGNGKLLIFDKSGNLSIFNDTDKKSASKRVFNVFYSRYQKSSIERKLCCETSV